MRASIRMHDPPIVVQFVQLREQTRRLNQLKRIRVNQEHVIERISRPSMNYLVYQVTIEDPKVLSKPWTSAPRVWTLGHEDLLEYYCTNNQDVDQYKALKSKESGNDTNGNK